MISIAMATYNGSYYIKQQLDSLLNQTLSFDELIICDDCSIDKTVEILKEYASKDTRIKIIVNKNNLGFNSNFQHAITLCTGNYIALCDQDDVWLPNHLAVLSTLLDEGALLAVGGTQFIDENDNLISNLTMAQTRNFPSQNLLSNTNIFRFIYGYMNPFQGASMMGKKEFFNKILPVPKSAYVYDIWLSLCASLFGGLRYTSEVISLWRRHSTNSTSNFLFHDPRRTLLGHIVKKGSLNNRREMLTEIAYRFEKELSDESTDIFTEALSWDIRRESIIGRLKNFIIEYKFWKNINKVKY